MRRRRITERRKKRPRSIGGDKRKKAEETKDYGGR